MRGQGLTVGGWPRRSRQGRGRLEFLSAFGATTKTIEAVEVDEPWFAAI